MPESPLLYYITDRKAFPGDELTRRRRLLDKIAEAASHGVDYIQLREKDLTIRELATALLINSRTDVALATAAAGVHLPANDLSPQEARDAWTKCGAGAPAREISPQDPVICVSCHSPEEVLSAAESKATFAVFAPVFEKKDAPHSTPTGLEALSRACRAKIPVVALGGVTLQNAELCLQA